MKTTLNIEGMTCEHCVRGVEDIIDELEGVRARRVDLTAGRAEVEHDEQLSAAQIAAHINETHYRAEVV